jgi:hypothetical protein
MCVEIVYFASKVFVYEKSSVFAPPTDSWWIHLIGITCAYLMSYSLYAHYLHPA